MTPTDIKRLYYCDYDHTYWFRGRKPISRGIVQDFTCCVPSVTSILARAGLSDISRVTPEALARGTAVHALCEHWMKQKITPGQEWKEIDEESSPYLREWAQFIIDTGWKPIHSERVVFSRQHWYCGRMDCVFELPSQKKRKKNVLVDLKTNTMPEHVGVQLAAYRWAAIESGIPIHQAICLVLKPNTYRVWDHDKEGSPREDWHKFKEALNHEG